MIVAKNTVVTLDYSVTDPDRNLLDSGEQPLVYLQGGYENIFAKIEEALEGKAVGHNTTVSLEPEDAFGEYDVDLMEIVDLDELPPEVEIGSQVERQDDEDDEVRGFVITDIAEGKAILDGNHPLAGTRLLFTCTITAIRPASPQEIQAGQAESLSLNLGMRQ